MSKDKETLMYVGGEPKKDSEKKEKKQRSEWEEKWDKIVNGEGTVKELGDTFTEGDINKLRTCKLGNVVGFSKKADRMRILLVHVGYSQEELNSPEFKDYMKRSKAELEALYGKKNIDVGFHIPDEETPTLTSYGIQHFTMADSEECAVLKRRLQKENGAIDILNVRINPDVVGRDYFGAGGIESTSAGPKKEKDGKYNLPYKYLAEHELMHTISHVSRKHNPTDFGDGYFRSLYDNEARSILGGYHQEFIPADENGKPIKSGNETMKKILEVAEPKDQNVFMVERNGKKHRLLVVNPGDNIMRGFFDNKTRAKALKEGTYITEAQKTAVTDVVKDYLIGEKRREADKSLQKPKMVVKNSSGKKQTAVNIAQKLGKGSRA